jgi:Lrp/AsnC family transcriptional regulator, leucine-responsive regulatory protein
MIRLDKIDKAILLELQQDNRIAYADLASKVGLSVGAVHERVKKLERNNVITAYRVQVNPEALGLKLTAFIAIRLENNSTCRAVLPMLREFPEIEDIHSIAGEVDVLVKARTADTQSLEDLIYKIKAVEGVSRTTSSIVLSSELEGRPLLPSTL